MPSCHTEQQEEADGGESSELAHEAEAERAEAERVLAASIEGAKLKQEAAAAFVRLLQLLEKTSHHNKM